MFGKILSILFLVLAVFAASWGKDLYTDYRMRQKLQGATLQTACLFPATALEHAATGQQASWHYNGRVFTLPDVTELKPDATIILIVDEIGETEWAQLKPAAATHIAAQFAIPDPGCKEKAAAPPTS